jgi:hypothetical protein
MEVCFKPETATTTRVIHTPETTTATPVTNHSTANHRKSRAHPHAGDHHINIECYPHTKGS